MDWTTLLSPAWGMIYLLIASQAASQPASPPTMKRPLQIYALAAAGWELLWFTGQAGWFGLLDAQVLTWMWPHGAMTLALVLLYCTTEFLPARQNRRVYLWAGGAVAGLLLVIGVLTSLPDLQMRALAPPMMVGIALGGLAMMALSASLTLDAYKQVRQPLHRARIVYWAMTLAATALGDILILLGQDAAGSTLRLVGMLIAAYIILLQNKLDVTQAVLWGVYGLVVGVITTVVFSFVIYQELPFVTNSRLVEAVLKGMGLALIVNLGMGVLSRYLSGVIFGANYDQNAVVRSYSQAISSSLELPRLAQTTELHICRVLGAQSVRLFTVYYSKPEDAYYLELVPTDAHPAMPPGRLAASSPVAQYLSEAHRPLGQYEIDFHPVFQGTPADERQWLSALQVDLFVPIHTQETWQGLFALQAKVTGERYVPGDLELMMTFSEQTAVALQNARLFSDVVDLNEDLLLAQKALEKANVDLRQVDQLKTMFISVVSHELRTPLANIAFSAQVLEMYGKEHFSAEERSQLDQLLHGVKMARGLIDNLIMLASFINEEFELQPVMIDFRDVLNEVLGPLEQTAREKEIKFQVNVIGDAFQVIGDRRLLKQVVQELVNNAIKYTNQGGEVFVSCWTSAHALCFDVQDSGIGIPAEKLDLVWDSFTQLQSDALLRGVEGLGLGLALVKYIIKAHGGFAWVESEPGRGSVFGFQTPLRGPRHPLDPASAPRRATLAARA